MASKCSRFRVAPTALTWRPSKRWRRRDDRRSTSRNPPCRTRRARASARTSPFGCCRPLKSRLHDRRGRHFCDLQSAKPPATRDARPAQSRHLCQELLEDPVGKPARRIRRLDAERGRRARRHQMLTCITTSQFTERCSTSCLSTGITESTCRDCGRARRGAGQSRARLRQIGLEIFAEPTDGMFVWARLPNIANSFPLEKAATAKASCSRPAQSFDRISNGRPGCNSTWRLATIPASCGGSSGSRQKRRTGTLPCERVLAVDSTEPHHRLVCLFSQQRANARL